MTTYYHRDWQSGSKPVVSSVRIEVLGIHAHISIWNRGGKAGTITVNATDSEAILDRLIPPASRHAGTEANDGK